MTKVLHIEDDPANRLLVRKLLTPAGFEVIDAADGLEGIRKAVAEPPDLVLVDIAIPGLDGYEVTLRLRSEAALDGVPIVAITAEGNRDTSLAVGCDGFLQKPIDARSFAATVRTYLAGRKEHASPDRTGKHLRIQSQKIAAHLEEKLAELSRANERLVELDLARKEFYRNVSHELSTPMTPIVGYVRLLLDAELGPLTPPQKKALGAMDSCVQRLRGLIDDLLDVTGIESGKMRFSLGDYDLVQVVGAAVDQYRERATEAELELITDVPGSALGGYGDRARLKQAVMALLDNAVKFTPKGGAVGVRVRGANKHELEVCVADTGPGVSAEKAGRLFEPFYQVDGSPTRQHGGAGIGLAIVRGVARGHGGDVHLQSPAAERFGDRKLSGCAFYVRIPTKANAGAG
ncbi:MAG: hybrid sensor histidine kinase/response regulator [Polyangiaceae bacterium]